MTNTMKNQEIQEPIYDERVNATIKGLMEGKTREILAEEFSLGGWKSLDIYMRRKGFVWDGANSTYIPATNKADKILEELSSSVPVKAEMIVKRIEEMGDDNDPRAIAKEFGFKDHRELGIYMETNNLSWDSDKKNYVPMIKGFSEVANVESTPLDNVFKLPVTNLKPESVTIESLEAYLPLLQVLLENKDRLLTLLMPQSDGTVPKYAVPGLPKTKSIFMSDLLARLMVEFSESKNISQREIMEAATIEYLKRYGFQSEVEKLLGKN